VSFLSGPTTFEDSFFSPSSPIRNAGVSVVIVGGGGGGGGGLGTECTGGDPTGVNAEAFGVVGW